MKQIIPGYIFPVHYKVKDMQSTNHNGVGIVYWWQVNWPKQRILWLHENVENVVYSYRTNIRVCKRVQKVPVRFRVFDFEYTR